MATANPSWARANTRARPIRCAPPVTSAASGIGGTGIAPVISGSPAGTALLSCPHFCAHYVVSRDAGASGRRSAALALAALTADDGAARRRDWKPEIDLLEPADLIAQTCRLFEFEVGGGVAHTLFEIGDHGLQIGALVVGRFSLRQPERHVIAFIDAPEDIGDPVAHALGRDPMGDIVGLLLFPPAVGFVDCGFETVRHAVGIEDRAAVDMPRRPPDRLDQRGPRAQVTLLVGAEHGHQRAFRD